MTSTHIFDEDSEKSIKINKLIKIDPEFVVLYKSEVDFFKRIGMEKAIVSCDSNKDIGETDGMSFYKIKDLNKFGIKNISFTDSGE